MAENKENRNQNIISNLIGQPIEWERKCWLTLKQKEGKMLALIKRLIKNLNSK